MVYIIFIPRSFDQFYPCLGLFFFPGNGNTTK